MGIGMVCIFGQRCRCSVLCRAGTDSLHREPACCPTAVSRRQGTTSYAKDHRVSSKRFERFHKFCLKQTSQELTCSLQTEGCDAKSFVYQGLRCL